MNRFVLLILVGLLTACGEQDSGRSEHAVAVSEVAVSEAAASQVGPEVEVTGGRIVGSAREDGLFEYSGIPYAAPPVGDLRWQPPQPVGAWQGSRDATKPGFACMQAGAAPGIYQQAPVETREDCLTLNVWSRARTTSEQLPVMVWIHGGALLSGSNQRYNGTALSAKGVVVVAINYRLGPFGFFAHPELSAENVTGASGNQGYRDQIAALEWVRDNIQAFGGDPDNVTIFGESAGSWSMSVLQASPMARGLFHKVIGQSGARLIPLPDLTEDRWGIPSGERWGEKLGASFSGQEGASLSELRALPAQDIMEAFNSNPALFASLDSLTIVDGAVLPEEVDAIFSSGRQADVPVLIGSNEDEATTFDPALFNTGAADLDYGQALRTQIASLLPTVDERIFDHYPTAANVAQQSWVEFNTDAMFTQPMRLWADYMENVSSPAYLYWWTWHPVMNGSDAYGAFHAAELPYVFGDFSLFNLDERPEDRAFSELMMNIWTNFAKTGNPSVAGVIEWPAYRSANPATVVLGEDIGVRQGIRSAGVNTITAAHAARRLGN